MQPDRQTGRQTDRDRQIDTQTDREADRQTGRQTGRLIYDLSVFNLNLIQTVYRSNCGTASQL